MVHECGARKKQCRKCFHQYSKDEYELWECPECGEDRHCTQKVRVEGERCRFHGGASPKGIASPHYKTGRWSRAMPRGLRKLVESALSDTKLGSLRDALALMDARIMTKLEELRASPFPTEQLKRAWAEYEDARRRKDSDAGVLALAEIREIIAGRPKVGLIWGEIQGLLEQYRKLADSHVKHIETARRAMTVEQVYMLIGAVAAIFKQRLDETVTDTDQRGALLKAVSSDIDRLLKSGDEGAAW